MKHYNLPVCANKRMSSNKLTVKELVLKVPYQRVYAIRDCGVHVMLGWTKHICNPSQQRLRSILLVRLLGLMRYRLHLLENLILLD